MEFRLEIKWPPDSNEGVVRIVGPEDAEVGSRQLRRIGTGARAFPVPNEGSDPAVANEFHWRRYCTATDSEMLQDHFNSITRGEACSKEIIAPFGAYLFATLLGPDLWNEICVRAGHDTRELSVICADDDMWINKLPWQLMHDGSGWNTQSQTYSAGDFLSAYPGVTILRRILSDTNTKIRTTNLKRPLRVLFVIGTDLANDPKIRAGREYFELVRALREKNLGMGLKIHLLVNASPKTLQQAVREFRPNIVHFICHGNEDGTLLLRRDNTDPNEYVRVNTDEILERLHCGPDGQLPEIVVLNACNTARSNTWQGTPSMAARLIAGGVPIVVGMAGQIMDQACRLFTRGFYTALLEDGRIAVATANGRHFAIMYGSSSRTESTDWALPVLFLASEQSLQFLLPPATADEIAWAAGAASYDLIGYPAFCDRVSALEWFGILLSNEKLQQSSLLDSQTLHMLAISAKQGEKESYRLGRTWLLNEMARYAAANGSLPCLLTPSSMLGESSQADEWPKDFKGIVKAITDALEKTAETFNIAFSHSECYYYMVLYHTDPKERTAWPRELRDAYTRADNRPTDQVLARALRMDMHDFLARARARYPFARPEDCKLVLLIDDVHRMADGVPALLDHFLGKDSLESDWLKDDVRVVFTYAYDIAGSSSSDEKALSNIKSWLYANRKCVHEIELDIFKEGLEAEMAYDHFMLYRQGPDRRSAPVTLARPRDSREIQSLYRWFNKLVKGLPSYLEDWAPIVIEVSLEENTLREANDEDLLMHLKHDKRKDMITGITP